MSDFFETVGKAIPNEFSKTSSVTRNIPYIGPIIAAIGAIDTFATTMDDTDGKFGRSAVAAGKSALGGGDPGDAGTPGPPKQDFFNTVGQIGSIFNAGSSIAGAGGSASSFSDLSSAADASSSIEGTNNFSGFIDAPALLGEKPAGASASTGGGFDFARAAQGIGQLLAGSGGLGGGGGGRGDEQQSPQQAMMQQVLDADTRIKPPGDTGRFAELMAILQASRQQQLGQAFGNIGFQPSQQSSFAQLAGR